MENDCIDELALLGRIDGDEDLLLEIVDIFLADSASLLRDVRAAVTRRDAKNLERAAHRVKGTLGVFGAAQAAQAAEALELMGRLDNLGDAQAACEHFNREFEMLVKQLSALKDKYVKSSACRR